VKRATHPPIGGPTWGAESEELNATILEWRPDQGTPEHVNDERDVLVVVLAGSAELAIGDRRETLRGGEALIIPKGERRRITAGSDGVRYLSAHRRRPPLQISPSPPR
jgi:quercetin dioxygenase-like cupin family protein